MRKRILTAAVAAATLASGAQAAGFYLKEQSVVGQGRAFAGSAAGTDGASAAYFNPAGIVGLDKQVEVGLHLIKPGAKVTDTGTTLGGVPIQAALGAYSISVDMSEQKPYDLSPVPNAHFIMPLENGSTFGLAVGAPFGLGNEYDNTYFGQFNSINAELATIELTASLAKQVSETFAVSAGLIYQSLELEQDVRSSTTVNAKLKGDSTETGFVLGFQKKLSPVTTVGFSYRSEVNHKVEGTQSFTNAFTGAAATVSPTVQVAPSIFAPVTLGPEIKVDANFDIPSMAALGIAHDISDKTTVFADLTYYGWSEYKTSDITARDGALAGNVLNTIENYYEDTVSYAIGMDHDYGNGTTVRAGIHYDPTPTQDEYRSLSTPDGDRTWLAFGMSKEMNETLTLDAAFTHIMIDKGVVNRTRVLDPLGANTTVVTKAEAKGGVNILSLGFRYKF